MPDTSRMRCLVVEDNEALRAATLRGLTLLGCACRGAASGREALEALRRDPEVEVVVSDIRMPELDGVQLLTALRRQYPDMAVLMLTGVADVDTAVECLQAGAYDYMVKVAQYAATTAGQLGLDPELVPLIELGAELHDVGKIGVDDAILHRAGPLTSGEYLHVQQHTVIGARILQPLLKNAGPALDVVRWHHERIDGRGLPDGLIGEAIPLHARLVAVVDAFDAMTTARSYRAGMTPSEALAELRPNAGRQFDARVVEAFAAAYPDPARLPIGTPPPRPRRFPRQVSGAALRLEERA